MNKKIMTINLRQYTITIILIIVVILFQITTNNVLLKPLNISNLISQNAYILILAIGMVFCIIAGGNIDLSVGSVAGFTGAVSAVFILRGGMSVPLAITLSLIIGLLIGMWHGFWIAYVGVPSFIATLGECLFFVVLL